MHYEKQIQHFSGYNEDNPYSLFSQFVYVFKVFESEHNHLVQYTYPDNMFAVKHSSLFFVMHNHCSVHVVIMNFWAVANLVCNVGV